MMLIADSGSTKTDWRFIDEEKKIHQFQSSGLNPFFVNESQVKEIVMNEIKPDERLKAVDEVFFYGAGCTGKTQQDLILNGLKTVFAKAKIEVSHDLLGACRSLCGRENGLVAILGTGSNACYFEQGRIEQETPSLGYVLGDEGSGAHIGKKLLQAFFYKELPQHLSDRFAEQFKLTKEMALEAIYRMPWPNRFLASFAPFAYRHKGEEAISNLVADSFAEFFVHHICKYRVYQKVPLHSTGSVAYFFGDIFRKAAGEFGVHFGKITEKPIAGLTLYHLEE